MDIWKKIKRLSFTQLVKLTLLFVKHPFKLIPTYRATKKTILLCNKWYRTTHHKSTKANAFRHAYWNILICKEVYKMVKNKQKSVDFAKKVTDLYEKVTQNTPLDEAMDLHNNALGRFHFLSLFSENEEEMALFLKNEAEIAKKVTEIEEIDKASNKLIYIED